MNTRPSKFISNELYVRFYKTARLYEEEKAKEKLEATEKVIIRMILEAGVAEMKNRLQVSGNAPSLTDKTLRMHRKTVNKVKKCLGIGPKERWADAH